MFNQLKPVVIITQREVRDQFRDWRIIFPVLGLTLFFPFLMNFTAQQILDFVSEYGATLVGERMVPFLFMIVGFFPISVSLVIALESFVGEKERGSIEPLLNTPLKDWQIYLGKLMSSTVPPLIGSYLGMGVYLTGLALHKIALPEIELMILIVVLTTIQAIVMVAGAVVVSTQATSVRAANLLASLIIIPAALLIQGESVIMFWGHTYRTLWWVVIGLAIMTGLLIRVGLAHFQREELLGKEIDILNFRWIISTFLNTIKGNADSILTWYRNEIPQTLFQLRSSIALTFFVGLAGFVIGYYQTDNYPIIFGSVTPVEMNQRVASLLDQIPLFSPAPVFMIWWQNLRVMIFALILGAFTLGILGMLPMIANMAVIGFLMGTLLQNGMPVTYFLSFIIPHGIIEIPAIIIATASILNAGARLAAPSKKTTFGEAWLFSVALWTKTMLGIVIPLLLISAAIEAWLTPRIVLWLFS